MDKTQSANSNEQLLASEGSLEERLKFETLLANLSARFVNLPADRIDSEIEEAQRSICELLDLDRSTLWEVDGVERKTLLLTHIYQPPEAPQPPQRMNAGDFFPWSTQKVLEGETVAISKISDLPPEAGRDLESYQSYGTKSNVLVPLSIGGESVFGLLTFSILREERSWTETILRGFELIAQVFANALARRQAENALRDREARLSLALSAAGAGLWIMYISTRKVWVAARTRELFHFTPDEEMTYQSFFKVIHPEDRERVNEAVEQALRSEESLVIDFRIVLPDKSIRWIAARGHRHPSTEPDRLMGVSLDVTDGKRAEQVLEERLRFEQLMCDLSGRFATISSEQVDIEVNGALEKIRNFFQADRVGLLTFSRDRTSYQITYTAFAEGILPLPLQTDLPRSLFPWVFDKLVDQQVVSVKSLQDLPEEADVDKESSQNFGIQAFLNIPITSGEIVKCISVTADRSERDWPEEYTPRLQLIGNVLFNALERQRAEKEARALSQRLITAHEDERRRLARELHDDLSQRLARLAIDAARVEPHLKSLSAVGLARSMREDAVRMSDDVHALSYRLHPSVLDDLGLGEALKAECNLFSRRESVGVELDTFDIPSELPSDVALCLFRIAQGALRNVARHARAGRVDLSVTVTDGGVQLTVKDDGVGFDPLEMRTRPSLGHASMRERIQLVHGTLDIQSAPGRGTVIRASVPLKGDSS